MPVTERSFISPADTARLQAGQPQAIKSLPRRHFSWYMQRNVHAEKNGGKPGAGEGKRFGYVDTSSTVQSRDSQRTVPVMWDFQKPKEAFRDQTDHHMT